MIFLIYNLKKGLKNPTHRIDDPNTLITDSLLNKPMYKCSTFIVMVAQKLLVGAYIYKSQIFLIFPSAESDGAVTINDENLLDTN